MKRILPAFALLLALAAPAGAQEYFRTLVPTTTIAAAVTGRVTEPVLLGQIPNNARYLALQANFAYGSAGTTAKVWVQTSLDGGATWVDIANFAFTTAALRKVAAVNIFIAATHATPTDGTLADNTIINGLLGDRIRVKYTTTGTYAGATSLTVTAVAR